MPRTREEIRQSVIDQLEVPQIKGTAGGSGNGTSTMRDNDLERFGDNDLIGAWLHFTSGSPTHTNVRITDNVQSTGIVTFRPAIAAAPDLLKYEILPYESDAVHTAINEAMDELYDTGDLVRNAWINHWIIGSPIYNSTFDYWDGTATVDGWTGANGGSGTTVIARLAYSSDHIVPSQFAVRLSGSAGGTLALDSKYEQFLQDLTGDSITIRAWIRTSTSSNSRAQLWVDGSAVASTDYHSGDGQWELVSATAYGVSDSATRIGIKLENATANAGDFGAVWVEGGTRVREYPFPIGLAPDGPDSVFSYSVDINNSSKVSTISARRMRNLRFEFHTFKYSDDELGVLDVRDMPHYDGVIRMPISVPLTLPTLDADNIEVSRMDSLLIAKLAAAKLLIKDMMNSPATHRQRAQERAGILMQEVRQLSEGRGATTETAVTISPVW